MLPLVRRNKIKELIYEKKSVSVGDLAKQFKVAEETIRRDLQELENDGVLKKIYGGATVNESVQDDVDVSLRAQILVREKDAIAKAAASFIHDGDSIFLDASTTSLSIAMQAQDKNITVITNSLIIANYLAEKEGIKLFVVGGIFHKGSMSFLGKNTEATVQNYFVDKAFISSRSVHLVSGITDSNEQQAEIRHLAMKHANTTYFVADHTKFDKTSFAIISDFSPIDVMITDKSLSEVWKETLLNSNVELIEVK